MPPRAGRPSDEPFTSAARRNARPSSTGACKLCIYIYIYIYTCTGLDRRTMGDSNLAQLKDHRHHINHPWASANCADAAPYRGFVTGHGKAHRLWDQAPATHQRRPSRWAWSKVALEFAATAYNVFLPSVIDYLVVCLPSAVYVILFCCFIGYVLHLCIILLSLLTLLSLSLSLLL